MKKMTVLFAMIFLTAASLTFSQMRQGTWELSLSGTLGSISGSSETSGSFGSSISEQESQSYLAFALRSGFCIVEGLQVEPEFLWTAIEDASPVFTFSGNLLYNFNIPESPVLPFILAGYGVGNGIPLAQRLLYRSSDKLDIGVLNIGAGFKFLVGERIALRTEYRYQTYRWERSSRSGSYSYSTKYIQNHHNVLMGFSVFLR